MLTNPFSLEYKTQEEDDLLIKKAVSGDKAALENLLKKHQPFVFNIARKMVQNPVDAEDITQEAMIKVLTNLSKFKGESQFRTWLYRIVVNHFLQTKKRSRELFVNEDFPGFSDKLNSFQDHDLTELEIEEKKAEIKELNLACLSGMLLCFTREQRLVYIIGELFGADHKIGAEILEITPGNFRTRLSRVRKDLTAFMNGQCGLVNKNNPCRCYKKVTAVLEKKVMDSKNLLFNKGEYQKFKQYISKDADEMFDLVEEKVHELHEEFTFNSQKDKKHFIDDFLQDQKVVSLLNLN